MGIGSGLHYCKQIKYTKPLVIFYINTNDKQGSPADVICKPDPKFLTIRRNTEKGLPIGTEKFIRKLERISDRILRYRPVGRPRKSVTNQI